MAESAERNEYKLAKRQERNAADRLEALEHYSGGNPHCVCCGESNVEFLTFDHDGGGGVDHRKQNTVRAIGRVLKLEGWPTGIRVLCHNCNAAHQYHGSCPHEKRMEWGQGPVVFEKLSRHAKRPVLGHLGDAGYDLIISRPATVRSMQFVDVRTDVAVSLPAGYWAEITGRSSTFRKRHLHVVHGVIDNGYRGELNIGVWNPRKHDVNLRSGERIAQLILHPLIHPEWVEVEQLPKSIDGRGTNGFGSTG